MTRLLSLLLALALACAAAPAAAQETAGGEARSRGLVQGLLEDSLSAPGRIVRIEGFEGALSSRAQLAELTVADARGVWLTVRGAVLDWDRSALLRGALEVEQLTAREIIVERPPDPPPGQVPSAEAEPFRLPELPVSVRVGRLAVDRLVLGEALAGQGAVFSLEGRAAITGEADELLLEAQRTDGPRARFRLAAGIDRAADTARLELVASEQEGGIAASLAGIPEAPALEFGAEGAGPLDDFRVTVSLATAGVPRLTGVIRSQATEGGQRRALEARLSGDLRPLFAARYHPFLGQSQVFEARTVRGEGGRLAIEALTLRAGELEVEARGEIGADGWPRRMRARAQITPGSGEAALVPLPGGDLLVGAARVTLLQDPGGGDGWQLEAEARSIARAGLRLDRLRLSGEGRLPDAGPPLTGTLAFDLEGLATGTPALDAALGSRISGRTGISAGGTPPLRLTGLAVEGGHWSLAGQLEAERLADALELALRGELALAMSDLSPLRGLIGPAPSGRAELAVAGTIQPVSGGFVLSVSGTSQARLGIAALDGQLGDRQSLDGALARDAEGLRVEQVRLAFGGGEVIAEGALAGQGGEIALTGRIADLGRSLGALEGPAELKLRLRRSGEEGQIRLDLDSAMGLGIVSALSVDLPRGVPGRFTAETTLELADLAAFSRLAGRPLGGVLSLGVQSFGDLRQAAHQSLLSGSLSDLSLGIPLLERLIGPEAALSGLVVGQEGDVRIERLTMAGARARLILDGAAGAGGAARFGYRLLLEDLADLGGPVAGPARLSGEGRLGAEALETEARIEGPGEISAALTARLGRTPAVRAAMDAPLEARLEGAIPALGALVPRPGVAGRVRLEARVLADPATGVGALEATAQGEGLSGFRAPADRLLEGGVRAELAAGLDPSGLVRLTRARLAAEAFEAEASGSVGPARSALELEARIPSLSVLSPALAGAARISGELGAAAGEPFAISARAEGAAGLDARLSGTLARDASRGDLRAAGTLPLAMLAPALAPARLEGRARFDLALDGPLALGAVSGTLATEGAELALPQLALSLRDISLSAQLSGGSAELAAAARPTTGGRLSVSGRLGLAAPFAADLEAELARVGLVWEGLVRSEVSGRLGLAGPLTGGALVSGAFALGETEMRIPSGALGAPGRLEPLLHVAEPAPVRLTRARAGLLGQADDRGGGPVFGLDLAIDAPQRIFVRGRGLDAELGGRLRLRGTTAAVVPEGRFDLIRGRLDLLGKRITLVDGALRLQGDFDPFLRFVGESSVEEALVRIILEGPATAPELTVTAVPDLPQDEALALLLFGRGLAQISPLQALRLANAVRELAGQSGEGIVGRLRENFGVDDLDFVTSEEGTAGVRVGKYLSENLYSDVTVDSAGNSRVDLNLRISPSLTARGSVTSRGETGVGIFYERDY